MHPISILQLEDSLLDADLELAHLSRAGLDVTAIRVESREQFESALRAGNIDLILADQRLPQFNGLEALTIAQRIAPEIPFIFVSGMLGEEIAIDSLKNGATDYVLKMRMERLGPSVKRAMGEVRERSERKRAESALQETESRFRSMADSAPVMIWTAGRDKNWNYTNKRWLDFTGLTIEESQGSAWRSLIHTDDVQRTTEAYDRAFQNRQEMAIEYRMRGKDGEYCWIVNRAVPRFDSDGEFFGFIGSCTDINDVKKTEERLRHSAKLESLGVLAGGIAHDFNNLLTGILGNASLVLEEIPENSGAVPFVENIVHASETAAQLTRQMLAYSGKGRFVIEHVDISREIREILPLAEAALAKAVDIRLELSERLPRVEADPSQIQQLVMNLTINAAESVTPQQTGRINISTSLVRVDESLTQSMLPAFIVQPGHYVLLCIRDNGSGMDTATRARIFDPFFTTKFTGRGLGLAAVSGIVRGHKAGLALDSQPGFGTEFRVYFPISMSDVPAEREAKPKRELTGSGTILVVDDEALVTRTARLTLQRYGYTVLTAQNGREAVDLFRALAPEIDLVLLDMTMPVLAGDAACTEIKAIRPEVPVIATSGFTEAEATGRFGMAVDAFIQKPYRAVQLAETVLEVLERRTV